MSTNLKLTRVRLVAVDLEAAPKGGPVVGSPKDAATVARAVLPRDREGFAVLHLGTRRRVLSIELAAIGSLDSTGVHPREVFKAAILANAHAIIVAHNHPSGDPSPSEPDVGVTKRLVDAGELLGIEVLDHVIVAADGWYSIRAEAGGEWGQ